MDAWGGLFFFPELSENSWIFSLDLDFQLKLIFLAIGLIQMLNLDNMDLKHHYVTFCFKVTACHVNGTGSCNRVNGVSVSATPPPLSLVSAPCNICGRAGSQRNLQVYLKIHIFNILRCYDVMSFVCSWHLHYIWQTVTDLWCVLKTVKTVWWWDFSWIIISYVDKTMNGSLHFTVMQPLKPGKH